MLIVEAIENTLAGPVNWMGEPREREVVVLKATACTQLLSCWGRWIEVFQLLIH